MRWGGVDGFAVERELPDLKCEVLSGLEARTLGGRSSHGRRGEREDGDESHIEGWSID